MQAEAKAEAKAGAFAYHAVWPSTPSFAPTRTRGSASLPRRLAINAFIRAHPDARERIPTAPFGTLSFTRALPTEWRGLSALEVLNLLKDSIDDRPHHDLTLLSRCQRRVTEYP